MCTCALAHVPTSPPTSAPAIAVQYPACARGCQSHMSERHRLATLFTVQYPCTVPRVLLLQYEPCSYLALISIPSARQDTKSPRHAHPINHPPQTNNFFFTSLFAELPKHKPTASDLRLYKASTLCQDYSGYTNHSSAVPLRYSESTRFVRKNLRLTGRAPMSSILPHPFDEQFSLDSNLFQVLKKMPFPKFQSRQFD